MVLKRIETYLRKTGISPTRFGRETANDPRLVFDMRQGREPRSDLRARIERFLETAQ